MSISWLTVFPSSTVMAPFWPTFSNKSDMSLPISLSPLADIVATSVIYFLSLQSILIFFSSPIIISEAFYIPNLISIGFIPAYIDFKPS